MKKLLLSIAFTLLLTSPAAAWDGYSDDAAIAAGHQAAVKYAQAVGWYATSPCKTGTTAKWAELGTMPSYEDSSVSVEIYGLADIGLEKDNTSPCSLEIDESLHEKFLAICSTIEHEDLHLHRDDGWHDPDEHSPLNRYSEGSSAECDAALPIPTTVTIGQVRRRVRAKVGSRKLWRLKVVEINHNKSGIEDVTIEAIRRHTHRHKLYLGFRDQDGEVEVGLTI